MWLIGMIGAKVAVDPQRSLAASTGHRFRGTRRVRLHVPGGRERQTARGDRGPELSTRRRRDRAQRSRARSSPTWTRCRGSRRSMQRDLHVENYFIGYLKHPYVSFYTGRGCRSKCTFCLWPQTVGGHRYRVRSPHSVIEEVRWVREHQPQVEEIFSTTTRFTDFRPRAEEIARGLGPARRQLVVNAKANVPYETLRGMKDNGLRLLLVGYESGNDQILHTAQGLKTDIAGRFTQDCRGARHHHPWHVHPGTSRRDRADHSARTIEFAKEINPHTIQFHSPHPIQARSCTSRRSRTAGYSESAADLVDEHGVQIEPISYPHLSAEQIFHGVETFYKNFYFRPRKIAELTLEMMTSWDMTKRRLREGVEFFRFLHART